MIRAFVLDLIGTQGETSISGESSGVCEGFLVEKKHSGSHSRNGIVIFSNMTGTGALDVGSTRSAPNSILSKQRSLSFDTHTPRLVVASAQTTARTPQGLLSGMNTFLDLLRITFRRDPTNFRPRINKLDSIKDREQKASGNFFFMDSTD